MHTLIAVVGALVAAAGSAALLARCFRTPRGDLIAWSVGLLGLLVSLGAQAMGYATGYDSAIFRAMELGGQVVAPLAFVVALWDVAGRSGAARFCARLYVGALGIIALVVLALDQLTTTPFTKTWPPPFTYYQVPPNYVLMFVSGGVTAGLTVWAVLLVLFRSSQPDWHDAVPGQLLGGLAALGLAYPGLAEFAVRHLKIHVPLGSVFTIALTLAAVLGWLAGTQSARLNLAAMHGQGPGRDGQQDPGRQPGRREDADRHRYADGPGRDDRYAAAGGFRDRGYPAAAGNDRGNGYGDDYLDAVGEGGVYRGGGLYRPERPGYDDARGRPDEHRRESQPADGYADFATGDFDPSAIEAAAAAGGPGWQAPEDGSGRWGDEVGDPRGRDDFDGDRRARAEYAGRADQARAGRTPADKREDSTADRRRKKLFGQITIYTLMEERIDEFDLLTERVVEMVRQREPDTLVFIAHAVPSAPTQRILYQVYRSRGAFQRHLEQPYMKQFDLDRRAFVLATNVVELGLQQAKVSPFPSVTELFPEPGYDTSGFERPDYLRDYGRSPAPRGGSSREHR
jgi:quinol monooxygenase YgiN